MSRGVDRRIRARSLLDMHVKDLKSHELPKKASAMWKKERCPFPPSSGRLLKMKCQGYVNLEYEINENAPLVRAWKRASPTCEVWHRSKRITAILDQQGLST